MTPPSRGRPLLGALLGLVFLALLGLSLTAWREPVFGLFTQPGRLEALVKGLGPAGPLAIILLQMAQVVLAPIPGQVVGLASGYLFGPWLGTLYSMAGLFLGSLAAVCVVRRWGRPAIERLVDAPALARIDRLSRSLGLPLLFLIFVLPFLPDDLILLVAGLTDIPIPGIMIVATIGRLPGVLVSCWLGTGATRLSPVQWLMVIAATLALAAPVYHWRSSLERLMWSLVERVTGRPRGDLF